MEIVNFAPQMAQIGASGICPHCEAKSYFKPVGNPHIEPGFGGGKRMAQPVQCEGCKKFGLVIGEHPYEGTAPFGLTNFYPNGSPNDSVDKNIPRPIAEDFSEALRCHWVKAFRACVTMCRRAIQASVLEHGAADGKPLVVQIDELFSKGKITEPLKDFAHEIRLTGNEGAHPDKDGLKDVAAGDAEAIIEFTTEYLHHVYVMPAKLRARKAPAALPSGG